MARIRSVHPGLWTDEAFVTVSPPARLLFIGLWNEADDQGVFEWKPITLKMRLAPADAVDTTALLNELLVRQMIMRFQNGEKTYGAIRNFRRYQRPEKPKAVHPLPDEAAAFVGSGSSTHPGSEKAGPPLGGESPTDPRLVANGSTTGRRMSGQREEGGGKRKEGREESPPTPLWGEIGLPDWLPRDAWMDWCRYRERLNRKGWTEKAAQLSFRTLEALRAEGSPPKAVIEQSIGNSWRGLFALPPEKRRQPQGRDDDDEPVRFAGGMPV